MLGKLWTRALFCPVTIVLMQSIWTPASANDGINVTVGIVFDEETVPDDQYRFVQRAVTQLTSDRNATNISIHLSWIQLDFTQMLTKYTPADDLLLHGVSAIISVLKCKQTRLVDCITEIQKVPHISASVRDCGCQREHTIGFDSTVPVGLLQTLVRVSHFETVGVIFDHWVDSAQRNRLMFALSSIGVFSKPAVWSTDFKKTEHFVEALRRMPAQIVILAESNSVRAIFGQVTLPHMSSPHRSWIIVTDEMAADEASLLLGSSSSANLLLVQPEKTSCSCCSEDLRRSLCGELRNRTSLISSRLIEAVCLLHWAFNQGQSEQTMTPCPGSTCYLRELLHQKILERQMIYDVTEIRHFPHTSIRVIGRWTGSVSLEINDGEGLFADMDDFGGRRLIIATDTKSPPFVRRSGNDMEFTGLAIDILSDIAGALNFTYDLVVSPDGFYGAPLDNGSWSGMIGMILRGEADMAVGPFTVTHQRAAVIDFSTAFMQQSVGILTPTPAKSPQLFQFLKPFSLVVWLIIATFVAMTGFCLFMIDYSTRLASGKATIKLRPKQVRLVENMELVVSSIFGQGPTFHPTVLSARCLLGVWLLFTELLFSMYTAHLAAVLTVATPLKPINSLEDLDSRDDMKILVESGTSTWTLFEQSKLDLYRSINAKKRPVRTAEIGIEAVKHGDHCFIGGRVSLLFGVSQSCGEIRVAEEQFFSSSYAFVLPKMSPYKEAVNFRILKMVEYGIVKNLKEKWFHTFTECPVKAQDTDFTRLSMKTLGGAFLVYGAVTVLGVILLIVEKIRVKLDSMLSTPSSSQG